MIASDQQRRQFYAKKYQFGVRIWDAPNEKVFVLWNTREFRIMLQAKTLSELIMMLAIEGYDVNSINFNKVAMYPEVKKFLIDHKIDHLEWKDGTQEEHVEVYE